MTTRVRLAAIALGAASGSSGEPVAWSATPLARRRVTGGVVFGIGWAVSDACPGPVLAQIGEGYPWSVVTLAGIVAGVALHARRNELRVVTRRTRARGALADDVA